ncbi:MAG: hypothetical protein NTV51_25060, partial [Verrucomicrobia bacterium]|nr:hypothetical protein [Verrucomicrobiota bacterium]
MSSPKKHTYTTDEKGRFVASFHDQFFELVQIQGEAAASVKYLAVFTRWDGNTYQTQHMQEQWGFYDRAQDPYARKWTIILP